MSLWCSFDNAWHISLPTCQWAKRFVAWGAHQSSDALYILIYSYIALQWVCFQWWLGSWLHNPRHHIERYNWSHSQDYIDWLDGTCMNIHIIHHCTGHTAITNHMKIVWGKQEVRTWKHEGPMKYTVFTFFQSADSQIAIYIIYYNVLKRNRLCSF